MGLRCSMVGGPYLYRLSYLYGGNMREIKRRSKTRATAAGVAKTVHDKPKPEAPVEFISSGSTTLNLALSGKGKHGGWGRGRNVNIVGDGSSGKTLLALEIAFWFFNNIADIKSKIYPKVKKFEICYDNGEGVMDFPVKRMYGERFYECVNWKRSKHFEAMCRRFIRKAFALKKGEALLYIIDSWDSFQSAKSKKAFMDSVKKDEDLKGDYDLAIQKYASRKFFPTFCEAMDQNKIDATLVIVSQVRARIGTTYGKKQYRAGGKALDFYTHQVAWIREIERLEKTKKKQKRVYGIKVGVKVERSKVAKPFREAEFTILYDYGLDDVGAMIDHVFGSGPFKFRGKEFKLRTSLIKYIEKGNHESELIAETERLWQIVEEAFEKEVKRRKPRF